MLLRFTLFTAFFALCLGTLTANTFRPTAVCIGQINVAVDENCVGTITVDMIDAGSSAPWGPVYLSLDQTEFFTGTHTVTLTAQDAFNRTSSCFSLITVEDKTAPELVCAGNEVVETFTPDDIDGAINLSDLVYSISDNCGSFSYSVSIASGNSYGPRSFTIDASDDVGNTTSCSGTINIIPPAVPTGYCNSYGNSTYEYIESMKITTANSGTVIDLVSGNNSGAAYFPAFPVDFVEGETVNFAYSPGYTGGVYAEYWRFYLDLNRDGDFDDAGELILYDKQNRDEIRYRSITLPETFSSYGPTRMRVVMAWSGYRGPCETGFWGEREDYLVNLEENTAGPLQASDLSTSKSAFVNVVGEATFNVDHPHVDERQLPVRKPVAGEVKVWPNPAIAGAALNLEIAKSNDLRTITIRQALGQTVAEIPVAPGQEIRSVLLPASLVPGVYLVSGADAERVVRWTERVVVR